MTEKIWSDSDYTAIGRRVRRLRDAESQTDFGKKYGKAYTDIGRIERGEVKPTPDLLFRICTDYHRSMEWMMTGREEPSVVSESGPIYKVETSKVDVFTLAGAGQPKVLTEYEPIETIWLPREFTGPSIVPVKIRGQSMNPTIWDGALVGIDREDRAIVSGELYAVWMPYEGAVVKRLFMEMDRVMVKSDNPQHPTFSVPYKDLEIEGHGDHFILGRVKWVIQKR